MVDDLTDVIFRKFNDGEVIALFPGMAGDHNPYHTCGSYMHTGQHGSAGLSITKSTKLATKTEYSGLENELWGLGYQLRVVKRFTKKHLEQRKGRT